MKKTILLILFGLADLLLILGIVYLVRQTEVLRKSVSSLASLVSEEEMSGTESAPEEGGAGLGGTEITGGSGAEEIPEAEDAEGVFQAGLAGAESGAAFSGAEEPVTLQADASSAETPAGGDPEAWSVPEEITEGLQAVLSDISEVLAATELPPTRRCLVDGSFWDGCPERDIQLLTPNPYSRPQYALEEVHDIVIHYVGNAGSTAQQNRDYFESLQDGSRSASSHFVVGLDGEIIQCVSCSEWAYASNDRNFDTLSIECCHPDESGKFNDATYRSVVELTAWLCRAFGIGPDHVIRHYDVSGKICPKYYVENPDAWTQMLADIRTEYEKNAEP